MMGVFVRKDTRGYYKLVKSYRDPKTGRPRQCCLYYLGKKPELTLARAKKLELDLDTLFIKGDLIFVHEEKEVKLELAHDGSQWSAEEVGRDPEDGETACLKFKVKNLKELARSVREALLKLETKAGIDSGIRVRGKLSVSPNLGIAALKELRLSLYELSQPPLCLCLPPAEPLPEVLNTSQALAYLRKERGHKITEEALYNAVRRGRLGCMMGTYKGGKPRAMLIGPGKPMPWERSPKHKRWGALLFLKKDLDRYVEHSHLPLRSIIAMEKVRRVRC
jgi:hypothetical protein